MITLPELLRDEKYKAYFLKVPKLLSPNASQPWRLHIETKEGKWLSKEFDTYPDAFRVLKKYLQAGKVRDAAISCRRQQFDPPTRVVRVKGKFVKNSQGELQQVTRVVTWKPNLGAVEETERHDWCPYCRRPVVFRAVKVHHALSAKRLGVGISIDPEVPRCPFCGASERLIGR